MKDTALTMAVASNPASDDDRAFRFGEFELHPRQRLLTHDGAVINIGSRALDILIALVDRAGQFLTNDELVNIVWPRTVVVDGNLRVHIGALRKILGDGQNGERYILNVPNRGYSFVCKVVRDDVRAADPIAEWAPSAEYQNVPSPLNRIIGRDKSIVTLCELVSRHRLVTIVGAGGIGKTTVALGTLAALRADSKEQKWESSIWVDLASLADPRLVPNALASSLGLSAVVGEALPSLLTYLHDKSFLIFLDNCEHVIEPAARLAESILKGAPSVRLLTTSREPLRAEGEWTHRLDALAVPAPDREYLPADALAYSGVELFVERAMASSDSFALTKENVDIVVEVCRRLDGIPLALELAAARTDQLGIRALAAALDDRFTLLNKGRRTAVPRHQTLRATLDWSFELLYERDKVLLTRLCVFAGSFPLEAAIEVAAFGHYNRVDVTQGVYDLVDKSLMSADVSGEEVLFRLLDTTRAYAFERLAATGELPIVRQRHAEHCRAFLKVAEEDWSLWSTEDWLEVYGKRIDDIRAALKWAFDDRNDLELGIAVTAYSAPLLFQLSLVDEHRRHAERAFKLIAAGASVDPYLEFRLNIALGHVVFHTRGILPITDQAFERAYELAQQLNDESLLAQAYSGLWMRGFNLGIASSMLEYAHKFRDLTKAEEGSTAWLMYDRMEGPAYHFRGDQSAATSCCERSLATPMKVARPAFQSGLQIDRRVSMSTILSRSLWVQGFADRAEEVIARSIEIAQAEGESIALAYTLAFAACPIAIWAGNEELARERTALLVRHTLEHSLVAWRCYGLSYQILLDWKLGSEIPQLPSIPGGAPFPPQLAELLLTMKPAFALPTVFARAEAGLSDWCLPEVIRVRALAQSETSPQVARGLLVDAAAIAERQGALRWQLRSTTSLVQLSKQPDERASAVLALESVLTQLPEKTSTPDLQDAMTALGR